MQLIGRSKSACDWQFSKNGTSLADLSFNVFPPKTSTHQPFFLPPISLHADSQNSVRLCIQQIHTIPTRSIRMYKYSTWCTAHVALQNAHKHITTSPSIFYYSKFVCNLVEFSMQLLLKWIRNQSQAWRCKMICSVSTFDVGINRMEIFYTNLVLPI